MTRALSFAGDSIITTITSDVASGDLTVPIASSTGWPSGAGGKPFVAYLVKADLSAHEKVLIASRTGLTLAVAVRGWDSTLATSFQTGDTIMHVFDAASAQAFSDHLDDPDPAGHSTLLNPTRHDTPARHVPGVSLAMASTSAPVGTTQTPGSGSTLAFGNHAHALDPSVAGPGLALALGILGLVYDDATVTVSGDTLQVKAGGIGATQLGAHAVGTAALALLSVDSTILAALAVTAGKIANGGVDRTAALADAIVTAAKLDPTTMPIVGAWTAYTPTVTGAWAKGNGSTAGRYMLMGKTLIWQASFTQGSTSTMNGLGGLSLPVTLNGADWAGTCKYVDSSLSQSYAGLWTSSTSSLIVCRVAGAGDGTTGARGDASGGGPAPFAWAVNDEVHVFGAAEAA